MRSRPSQRAEMPPPARRRARDRGRCRRRDRRRSSSSRCKAGRRSRAGARNPRHRALVEGNRASVSVPVLSVNRTSMLPRSSIVTSRFTSTRLRASLRDPLARLTETRRQKLRRDADGDCQREQQRLDQRPRSATLMMKIDTRGCPRPSPAGWRSRAANLKAVWPDVRRVPRQWAEGGPPGRETTMPSPAPWWMTVPMKAHDGRSVPEVSCRGRLSSTGSDSPVSTASSHSSWFTPSSRRSAGTMSPTRSATISPGTSSATSVRDLTPSRKTIVV